MRGTVTGNRPDGEGRHRGWVRYATCGLVLLVASALGTGPGSKAAHAGQGQQTGRIEGQVQLEDGAPAAAVAVVLSSELLPRERTARTDSDGRFRFVDLAPGRYDVSVADESGRAHAFDIEVHIAEVRAIALRLTETGTETIYLEDVPLDTSRATVAHRVDRELFQDLPVRRTSFASLLALLPGTGEEQTNGFLTVNGGSWVDNQLLIDGVNYSDPITNSLFSRFDFYAVEQVEILGGGLEAEYGEASGGVVNIITRSGGDRHSVSGRLGFGPGALSDIDGADALAGRHDINLNVGGPLAGKQARYFANMSYQRAFDPAAGQPGLDIAPGRTTNRVLGFGKLTWEPRASDQLTLHTSGFFERYDDFVQDSLVLAEAQEVVRVGGVTGQLDFRRRSARGVWQASLGGYYYDSDGSPASGDVDTPAIVDLDTGVVSQNAQELFHNRNLRVQMQASGTRYLDFHGSHELRAGAELSLMSILYETAYSGNEIVYVSGGPCAPEDGVFDGCVRAERTGTENADGTLTPGRFSAAATGTKAGVYVRDSWQLGGGVRINPGWRADIGRIVGQDGETMARFSGLLGPRLGLTWDIGARGHTALRVSGSRYYQTGMLALPLFFGPSIRRESYRFNQATRQFDILEAQRSSGGDSGGEVDLSLSSVAPHTDELVVGLLQKLPGPLQLGVTATYRRATHLYDSREDNLIWNEVGDSIVGFRDGEPRARYTLFTSADIFREYAGLEVSLRGRFARTGTLLASYTLSRLRGTSDLDEVTDADNVVPYVAANPRQRQYLYGPLKGDRRHVVKATVSYRLPRLPLTIGSTFSGASGTPYSRLYYNAYLNGYFDRRAARGIDPGELNDPDDDRELRTDTIVTWNLFAGYDLSSWTGIDRLMLELQIDNALMRTGAIKVEERNVVATDAGGGFGAALVRQEPFRVQLGVSFRY